MASRFGWSQFAYGGTFLLLGVLGAWWTVLLGRLVDENHMLRLAFAPDEAAENSLYDRERLMLLGESGALTALTVLGVAIGARFALRERDQARRLEGVLAASTHELKTPIAGVKALLESMQSGVLPPDRAGPHLDRGLAALRRLEHLVESLLAYQSAVARAHDAESHALGELIGEIMSHRAATVPGERVVSDEVRASPARVAVEPDAMRVIVENLLDNAFKYGARSVTMRVGGDERRVALALEDDGDGFTAEVGQTLFEPYKRGTMAARAHGTGLGLYLAREMARGMGGDLRAQSEGPGCGATFTVWLRRADG